MQAELVANYLSALKEKEKLTYKAIADLSKLSESTVKNLCLGNTPDPRLDTVAPVVYALGGSIDEMYCPEKFKKKSAGCDEHIHKQHHDDIKDSYEKRLADKKEIIESQREHINTLKKENLITKIALCVCVVVFITVLIAEVMNPNLGWFRY